MATGHFRIGCAVWSYRGWHGSFYPPGTAGRDALACYGQRLTAVEGNTTFYAVPDRATVERWRDQVPSDFRFCLKLPQTITHQGAIAPRLTDALAFYERVSALGDRLGPMFAQLPPSYGPEAWEDLQDFLGQFRRATAAPLAVEFRHRHWFDPRHRDRLADWLDGQGIGRAVLDTRPIYENLDPGEDPQRHSQRRKPRVPVQGLSSAGYGFVRFISHPQGDRNDRWLDQWRDRVADWLRSGKDVYFFVHCPIEDHSPATAQRFQRSLEAIGAAVPPLPWDAIAPPPPPPDQLSLFSPGP
ncbi:MAG: DUF72 domain-containing protein [Cyanobacteria bacterium]|nr:DUF72 domain-containing protein [Cyanobacteriota bacterium]